MNCERCKSNTNIIRITANHDKLCPECEEPVGGLRKKQSELVRKISLLILYAYEQGYELTFGDAYAQTGHMIGSLHYSRLAVDLNLFKDGKYLAETEYHLPLGEFWESIGGTWGGRWAESKKGAGDGRDGNHYSLEYHGRK